MLTLALWVFVAGAVGKRPAGASGFNCVPTASPAQLQADWVSSRCQAELGGLSGAELTETFGRRGSLLSCVRLTSGITVWPFAVSTTFCLSSEPRVLGTSVPWLPVVPDGFVQIRGGPRPGVLPGTKWPRLFVLGVRGMERQPEAAGTRRPSHLPLPCAARWLLNCP